MTADAATRPSGPTQSQIDALSQASAAVVGLQVTAAEGARSALTLGQERTGSGVVIGADGLVLTVDYLIQAAQQIEIVTQEGKTIPAVGVAYDIATGFGLIKPLLPLRGMLPVNLGSQQSHRPWLGLTSIQQFGRVQIIRVSSDSPAEAAGLEPGDVVLAVDESKVAKLENFDKKLWARTTPDAPVTLTILQGADIKTVVLKPQDRMFYLKRPAGI